MKPPRNIKEVQRLTGCNTALGCFMSRSTDKWQPFFRVLWSRANFVWNDKADKAFQALKTNLAHLPKIASPLPEETLLLYLAVLSRSSPTHWWWPAGSYGLTLRRIRWPSSPT